MIGLHDHGGNKYFGLRKITRISKDPHPLMIEHQRVSCSGLAWANELARRGYVVQVHDTFTFGSRRMRLGDLPAIIRNGLVEQDPESNEEIKRYNDFCGPYESLVAKSLFSAGMTWPGVFIADDRIRAACCAGMMTTWSDFLLNKAHTHTWMCSLPGMLRDLDYPEILGLAAPNAVMVWTSARTRCSRSQKWSEPTAC